MSEGLLQDLSQIVAELNIRRSYGNLSKQDNDRFKWYMRVTSEAMEKIRLLEKKCKSIQKIIDDWDYWYSPNSIEAIEKILEE